MPIGWIEQLTSVLSAGVEARGIKKRSKAMPSGWIEQPTSVLSAGVKWRFKPTGDPIEKMSQKRCRLPGSNE
jgi:hypothetical protein